MFVKFQVICLLLAVAIVMPGRSTSVFSSDDTAKPDIQFMETAYDFGFAGQQEKVSHSYNFKNAGTAGLIIEAVKASCGCVAAVSSAKEIPPGGTGSITATFETGKYKGKQIKTIHVHSNDRVKPEIELQMTGMVKLGIALEPESVYFGDVQKNSTVNKVVKLSIIDGVPFGIDKIDVPDKYISTRVSDASVDSRTAYSIEVTLKPDAPAGSFTEVITVNTDSRLYPRIDIPVIGTVVGDIKVKPQSISFGTLHKGDAVRTKIVVESVRKEIFHIQKVTFTPPFLSAQTTCNKENTQCEITLKIDVNSPAGPANGEIRIYTDAPDQPVLTVPVSGLIIQ